MVEGEVAGRRGLGAALVAVSSGVAVAAVALSVYAFARRVPEGLVSDRLGAASQFLAGSLAGVAIAAVVLIAGAVAALAGRAVAAKAAWVLTALAAITAFVWLSSFPRNATASVSGPGARPVVALTETSWLLLTIAAVLLVAGAAATQERKLTAGALSWRSAVPLVAGGIAVALVGGSGVVAAAQHGAPRAITATVTAVAELPTTVGTVTAYTVTADSVNWLAPAGAGFVLSGDGAVTAYDGVAGTPRWRFPLDALPQGCSMYGLRSTGTSADAVVIVGCNHDAGYGQPRTDPFLVGLDAMTGQLLWTLDDGWGLRSRISLPSNTVPVVNLERNELGSLDPRTGSLRWTWSFGPSDEQCSDTGYVGALDARLMYAVPCGGQLAVHVFDAVSGAERVIYGPVPQEFSGGSWVVEPHALDGDVAVVRIRLETAGNDSAVLSIDTSSGRVDVLPVK